MATENKQQAEPTANDIVKAATTSAIVKQWTDLKTKHPDANLWFRTGDFYTMYNQDAEKGGKILGITVLKDESVKAKGFTALASFPYHALDTYLPKLIRAGERIAICDQLEAPKKKKEKEQSSIVESVEPKKQEKAQKEDTSEVIEKKSSTKTTSKKGSSGKSAEDKALDKFADMMIEKIKSFDGNWQKPWFTEGSMAWPKNLSGRGYNGMNALMLMMHAEREGYKIPVYATFASLARLNQEAEEKAAKKGEEAPRVMVNKGEKSFPVMLTTFTVIDKETKERIKYDDYKQLSEEEKEKYHVYPKMQVFNVFNVAQTNMQEMRPDLWQKLESENMVKKPEARGELLTFEPVEKMIKDNLWICPIKPTEGDQAYFSISKNEIVVPEKQQFKDGESFYSTLFHEMTHSTGQESVLNRIKPTGFGSSEYAREELVAELGAALVAQRYGMTKNLKEDSAAYLKSWLGSLKESPDFIKTTLVDVKRATAVITQSIDDIAERLDKEKAVEKQEGKEVGVKAEKTEKVETSEKKEQPIYYSSVAYLQMADDTQRFEELKDKGDYKTLLQEAAQYDQGNAISLQDTHKSPLQNRGDDILDENDKYAVVYNASVGGTFDIMRKVTEQEVLDNIQRYGLSDDVSKDVKELAKRMEDVKSSEELKNDVTEPQNKSIKESPKMQEIDAMAMFQSMKDGKDVRLSDFKVDASLEEVISREQRAYAGKLEQVRGRASEEMLQQQLDIRHDASEELVARIKKGETIGTFQNIENVDLKATLARTIGEQRALVNELDVIRTQSKKEKVEIEQPKTEAKTENKQETKVEPTAAKQQDAKEDKSEKQRREPQMVTVNGDKVSHAHAFQHNQNPDLWLFTAKINDKPLHPMVMTKEDVAAYQAKETSVKELMERYYPTKMQKQLSPEEYKAGTKLSDGQTVEKFRVFKESVKEHEDFGKWKGYAEVGGKKMVAVMSSQDLNAYFDRTQTPAQIVERTFGEKLHLASAYKDYKLPEGVKEENVRISKDRDGKWKVSVDLGDKGITPKKPLSFDDGQSFFRTKTATRGQLAAKYLAPEMHSMLSEKQDVKKSMKR